MAQFTIESTFMVPHYRHTTYEAETLEEAMKMAEADEEWGSQLTDFDNSTEPNITGAWAGEDAYVGDNLLPKENAEDDGCPNGDPNCEGGNGDCHDACSTFAERGEAA